MTSVRAFFSWVGIILGIACALVVIAFFFNGLDFSVFSFFAPKVEAVRYNTFKNSQAYNEGTIGDLMGIRDQYVQSKDQAVKDSLRSTFIYKKEHYPNPLPPDLQAFYDQLTSQ
jgi:hypothetical protein